MYFTTKTLSGSALIWKSSTVDAQARKSSAIVGVSTVLVVSLALFASGLVIGLSFVF